MGQKVASLEIELLMATGQAVSDLLRFGGAIDKQSANAIAALDKIDAAMKGIGDMSAVAASMEKFAGSAATTAAAAVRAMNQIENAGERVVAQLERQIDTYGKTKVELADMRAETAALNAEQAGMVELADRIRTKQAALNDVRAQAAAKTEADAQAARDAAQAYQMFEARVRAGVAALQEQAAAEKAAAAEANAQAIREAAAAYQMFEARVASGAAALREQEAEQQRMAAAAERLMAAIDPLGASQAKANAEIQQADALFAAGVISLDAYAAAEARARATLDATTASIEKQAAAAQAAGSVPSTPMQSRIDVSVGSGFGQAAGSAQASARAMAALLDEQEKLEARTKALTAAVDPMAAAQARANEVVGEARALYEAGAISAETLAKAEKLAADASRGHSTALGLNSTQLMIAEGSAHRFIDSLMSGMSPMKAFMMQAGDLGSILQMDDGGVAGGLAKVRALINPVTIGIAAATAVVAVGAAAWLTYANAIDKANALAQGSAAVIGATGEEIEAAAQKGAAAGDITIGSARKLTDAYVDMGGIGKDVLGGLVALTGQFAAATGTDAAEAQKTLGAAFQDPVKGAEELTARYGSLTQAQIDHIQQLVEQNNLYGAQKALLADLGPQFDHAADHANVLAAAWRGIKGAAADAWDWMGRAIDRALGGGSDLQKLQDLQNQRQNPRMIVEGMGPMLDQQIAELQAKMKADQAAQGVAAARAAGQAAMSIAGSASGDDQLDGLRTSLSKINTVLADTTNKAGLTAAQIAQLRQTQDDYTHAVNTWLPAADKANKLAEIDAQIAATKNPAQLRALNTQKALIEQSGQLVTGAQAEARAHSEGAKAYAEAQRSVDSAAAAAAKRAADHAAQLARDAAAEESQIKNLYSLADAYGVSDAAALQAEARVKAEAKAIKDRGSVEAEVDRQTRLLVAQQISDSAKSAASMEFEATAQAAVNKEVEAGLIPAARAAETLRDMIALRQAQAAADAAAALVQKNATTENIDALEAALTALERLTKGQKDYDAAREQAQFDQDKTAGGNQLAQMQKELRLIGATDAARVHALATLKATQEATAKYQDPAHQQAYIATQVQIADTQEQVTEAQNNYNDSLSYTADLFDAIDQNAQRAGQGISDAFGTAGKSISDAVTAVTGYYAQSARLAQDHDAAIKKAGTDQQAIDRENTLYATRSAQAQVGMYGDILSAAKGLFSEHSKGYKVMQAAEEGYRAVQLALSVAAMVQNALETTTSVANAAARAAADGTAGVAAQAKLPFPANIAAMAATAAALIAAGVAIVGLGGSHETAADYSKGNDGSGTILGDATAQSDSIKRAVDSLKEVDTLTNTFAREMAQSLKSIDSQIGNLASVVVRAGDVNADASVQTGFKTDAIGGALSDVLLPLNAVLDKIPVIGGIVSGITGIIKSLFGTKTTVIGNGIYGGSQTIGDVLNGGFDASYYSDVEKKKKFLGITTGTKYSTAYTDADPAIEQQFSLVLKSFYTAIASAAAPLGQATDAVEQKLQGFVVNIGKIDLDGLTGDQISDKLQAVFGAAADDMAKAAFPDIERFQQVGEGAFETLVRVASTVEQVTSSLDELGMSTQNLSIDAKMGLAGQFDSISDLTSAVDTYFQDYYTQAEQAAAKTAQFAKVFQSLGLAVPATLDDFRHLVEAQDLTTTAGQQTYAALLQLAPAFADLQSSLQGAKSAADIASEQQDLQRQLYEAQGNTAAERAMDLANLDPSNRALQEQVWAVQDAKDAADAASQLAQAWTSVGDSIMDEVNRIRGLTDTTAGAGFASLMGQFNAATAAARAGDQDAAKNLPQLSQSLLTAAAAAATSRQELDRVQAQTAASLEATYAVVSGLATDPTAAGTTTSSSLETVAATQAATGAAASTDDVLTELKGLRSDVAQLRSDNNQGHANTASKTNSIDKKLGAVTQQAGGIAISTVAAAA